MFHSGRSKLHRIAAEIMTLEAVASISMAVEGDIVGAKIRKPRHKARAFGVHVRRSYQWR